MIQHLISSEIRVKNTPSEVRLRNVSVLLNWPVKYCPVGYHCGVSLIAKLGVSLLLSNIWSAYASWNKTCNYHLITFVQIYNQCLFMHCLLIIQAFGSILFYGDKYTIYFWLYGLTIYLDEIKTRAEVIDKQKGILKSDNLN